jgi:hypothetical protein
MSAVAVSYCPMGTISAAPALLIDFGHDIPPATPAQPGFTAIAGATSESSRTAAVGAFSVTVEGDGFYHAGFNAGNVGASVAPLFEDYYYNNSADPNLGIKVTITGVIPNVDYDVKIWSYDEDNLFSVTPTMWGPAAGSSTVGTSGLVSDSGATPYPTAFDEKSTTIRLQSTTNALSFFGSSTGGSGGTRLNGFQLALVPEPAGLALVSMAALAMVVLRRKTVG